VYTTTADGANFRANQQMREKLLLQEDKLDNQDDQLQNIMSLGQQTIDTMNDTHQNLRQ